MGLTEMSDYERRAWEDLTKRRDRFFARRTRRFVPEVVRHRARDVGRNVLERARDIPGEEEAERVIRDAAEAATDIIGRAAVWSMPANHVLNGFRDPGNQVIHLPDIREFDLSVLDDVRPRLAPKYMIGAGASGAGAGFVISGGEVATLVGAVGGGAAGGATTGGPGAVPGSGAGAGPGLSVVAGAMAADAAATMFTAMRLVFETGAYYGYDANRPEERLQAMAILNVATAAGQGPKIRAYQELNRLVKMIVRNATWAELNQNVLTRVVRRLFLSLTERLTKRKLAIVLPFIGVALGGGMNTLTMSRIADASDLLYRERFLREKYDLPLPDELGQDEDVIEGDVIEDEIRVAEIVDEELDGLTEVDGFRLQFDPAEIRPLAERFSYDDDAAVRRVGASAARRGYYTREEFTAVCNWKTPRSRARVATNSAEQVETQTKLALGKQTSKEERMTALTALVGVGVPTASALLHFAEPERYPILDVRALESLGRRGQSTYSTTFWLRYLAACQALAEAHGVPIRTLDKALWQHSKERQRPHRRRVSKAG